MATIGIALYYLFDIMTGVIFIRCILTWFPGGYQSKLYDILSRFTDPIEEPIRNIMYKYNSGPIDFSPMIAMLVLMLLKQATMSIFF